MNQSIRRGQYCFHPQEWKGTSRESRDFVRRMLKMDPSKRMTVDQALNHPWVAKHVDADAVMIEEEQRAKTSYL